jgi:hypothetical protein
LTEFSLSLLFLFNLLPFRNIHFPNLTNVQYFLCCAVSMNFCDCGVNYWQPVNDDLGRERTRCNARAFLLVLVITTTQLMIIYYSDIVVQFILVLLTVDITHYENNSDVLS